MLLRGGGRAHNYRRGKHLLEGKRLRGGSERHTAEHLPNRFAQESVQEFFFFLRGKEAVG
jgi:hypothetical protein